MGEYGLHNTPAGLKQIIDAAVKVCPALADLAIERTWAGLRPVTPDTHPVLGASSHCANLFVAGGYWRNGVLLAPKTAQLVADAVCGCLSEEDQEFVSHFSMDRFIGRGRPQQRKARESSGFFGARAAELASGAGEEVLGLEEYGHVGDSTTGVTEKELLRMERAALEGMKDGVGLEALFDEQRQRSASFPATTSATPAVDSAVPSFSGVDYDDGSATALQEMIEMPEVGVVLNCLQRWKALFDMTGLCFFLIMHYRVYRIRVGLGWVWGMSIR